MAQEGRDEKGKIADEWIKQKCDKINSDFQKVDDRIHDMIVNPGKYKSNKYNGFIRIVEPSLCTEQPRLID